MRHNSTMSIKSQTLHMTTQTSSTEVRACACTHTHTQFRCFTAAGFITWVICLIRNHYLHHPTSLFQHQEKSKGMVLISLSRFFLRFLGFKYLHLESDRVEATATPPHPNLRLSMYHMVRRLMGGMGWVMSCPALLLTHGNGVRVRGPCGEMHYALKTSSTSKAARSTSRKSCPCAINCSPFILFDRMLL